MGKTITRAHLSEAVTLQTGLAKADIAQIADRMFDLMSEALINGKNVKLTGFGSLQVRARAERVGRNPRTGTEHVITPRHTVVFTPGAIMRVALSAKPGTKQPDVSAEVREPA